MSTMFFMLFPGYINTKIFLAIFFFLNVTIFFKKNQNKYVKMIIIIIKKGLFKFWEKIGEKYI